MDPRLFKYYSRELQHVREMGAEFAAEFPKVAGRLGMEGLEVADPYVERLIEAFAFLAARVQLRLDAEFPRFTQHLLEMVYPGYLAPVPSMAVVQLQPDPGEAGLAKGMLVRKGSVLRAPMGPKDRTPCEYRTGSDLTLWPIELVEAEYVAATREMTGAEDPRLRGAKSGIRLRLRTTAGLTFDNLKTVSLLIFLRGTAETPMRLYEQLLANAVGAAVRPAARPPGWQEVLPPGSVVRVGFEDGDALLPGGPREFSGYRLLREYFAFPERFLFVEVRGLDRAFGRARESELDLILFFDRVDPQLQGVVDAGNFALHCVPVINLVTRRADSIHLTPAAHEYHVVPDRTAPMDYEVYSVSDVVAMGTAAEGRQQFRPFYARTNFTRKEESGAFYTLHRTPRVLSEAQQRDGPRTSYVGSEVFISLVDGQQAPLRSDLRLLTLETLCTNRDLPLTLALGQGRSDFSLQTGGSVKAVRCLAGPSKPRPAHPEGEFGWRLVSHLSLNYLSLVDSDEIQGAAALREILSLYGADAEAHLRKQVEGVKGIESRPIHRRLTSSGSVAYGRGLEVTLTLDEAAFGGTGAFLLGAILDQFLARYASINSFTETVVRTTDRGEIVRWPARIGTRRTV